MVGVLCQAGFSQHNSNLHLNYDGVRAINSKCLDDIPLEQSLMEYRYHMEKNLGTREVSCAMPEGIHVDYRRGKLL